jgi:hypothetical protein
MQPASGETPAGGVNVSRGNWAGLASSLEYKTGQTQHSPYMGKFINKFVFEALPPGVLDELKARLPKNEHGNRRAKLWQLLTVDTGIPHLDRQLTADLTLMQISENKQQFEDHWDKLFGQATKTPAGHAKGAGKLAFLGSFSHHPQSVLAFV